jgi:hypothetical protein
MIENEIRILKDQLASLEDRLAKLGEEWWCVLKQAVRGMACFFESTVNQRLIKVTWKHQKKLSIWVKEKAGAVAAARAVARAAVRVAAKAAVRVAEKAVAREAAREVAVAAARVVVKVVDRVADKGVARAVARAVIRAVLLVPEDTVYVPNAEQKFHISEGLNVPQ